MVRIETVYGRGDGLTPDVAAELTKVAERYRAKLQMKCGGKQVLLDSLIGILSVECRRGMALEIIAEGIDERPASEAIAAVLEGK